MFVNWWELELYPLYLIAPWPNLDDVAVFSPLEAMAANI
jgi:hypothetical protein